jgi:hypothetical protein
MRTDRRTSDGKTNGSFHKQCTRRQNCGVDDAIAVTVMPVAVEAARVFVTSLVYDVLN